MRYSLKSVEYVQPNQRIFSVITENGRDLLRQDIEILLSENIRMDSVIKIFSYCELALKGISLPSLRFRKLHTQGVDLWETILNKPPLRLYLGRLRAPSCWVVLSLSKKTQQKKELRRLSLLMRDLINSIES